MFIPILTEKRFNCQVCHRSYSTKCILNQHMKVRDDSKSFKCNVCLKVFQFKSHLKRHYRTDTGGKPFVCQNRERKFTRKGYHRY